MADHSGPDLTVFEWALGGVAAAGLSIAMFLWLEIGKLWSALDLVKKTERNKAVEDERRFATKEDLEHLGARLEARMDQGEQRIMSAIRDRGPVRGEI